MWKIKYKDGRVEYPGEQLLRDSRLGDKVHAVAQPIAKAIDKVTGTNIQRCGGCKRRRAALNGQSHSFKP